MANARSNDLWDEVDVDDETLGSESWESQSQEQWCEHPAPADMAIVVGDDRHELDLLRGALADLGYDAVPVPDAETALEYLTRLGGVELLVTDARLASTGGLDLIVAAHLFDAELPIVAVTGGSNAALREHSAVLRGADAVVRRPFTRWQFMDAVDAARDGAGDRSLQSTGEDEPEVAA